MKRYIAVTLLGLTVLLPGMEMKLLGARLDLNDHPSEAVRKCAADKVRLRTTKIMANNGVKTVNDFAQLTSDRQLTFFIELAKNSLRTTYKFVPYVSPDLYSKIALSEEPLSMKLNKMSLLTDSGVTYRFKYESNQNLTLENLPKGMREGLLKPYKIMLDLIMSSNGVQTGEDFARLTPSQQLIFFIPLARLSRVEASKFVPYVSPDLYSEITTSFSEESLLLKLKKMAILVDFEIPYRFKHESNQNLTLENLPKGMEEGLLKPYKIMLDLFMSSNGVQTEEDFTRLTPSQQLIFFIPLARLSRVEVSKFVPYVSQHLYSEIASLSEESLLLKLKKMAILVDFEIPYRFKHESNQNLTLENLPKGMEEGLLKPYKILTDLIERHHVIRHVTQSTGHFTKLLDITQELVFKFVVRNEN